MSHHRARSLHHALKQVALTGVTGSLLLGGAVAGIAAPGSTASASAAAARATAPVPLRATPAAAHLRHRVDVKREMRTAASLKGRPYRYGAAGPRAFDCSGYTQYVLKRQGIRLNRTAGAQYRQTRHVSKRSARVGDLVFFYGGGGIYHVGIYAGHRTMWAAPHTGAVVRHQKIWGSNWLVGRLV